MIGWAKLSDSTRTTRKKRRERNGAKTILCNILLLLSLLLCIGRDNSCHEYAMNERFTTHLRTECSFRFDILSMRYREASPIDTHTHSRIRVVHAHKTTPLLLFDSFVLALAIIKCKYIWRILPRDATLRSKPEHSNDTVYTVADPSKTTAREREREWCEMLKIYWIAKHYHRTKYAPKPLIR